MNLVEYINQVYRFDAYVCKIVIYIGILEHVMMMTTICKTNELISCTIL